VGRILLTGAAGQLGTDLRAVLAPDLLVPLTRRELDITDREAVDAALEAHAPAWVINTAAFHRVDDIERDPAATRQAFLVNAAAVHHLVRACTRRGARLLHLSTDYVFSGGLDGGPPGPYAEDAVPAPVNAYGTSKLAGERLILEENRRHPHAPPHVIVRSSGLYGVAGSSGKGGNFVETMLRLAREGKPVRVVDDQVVTPTYTADLAAAIARLLAVDPPGGVYHLVSAEACSWHEFAREIFRLCRLGLEPTPITSEALDAPAARPSPNGALLNTRAIALGVPPLRPWREALRAYLEAQGHRARG